MIHAIIGEGKSWTQKLAEVEEYHPFGHTRCQDPTTQVAAVSKTHRTLTRPRPHHPCHHDPHSPPEITTPTLQAIAAL